MKMENGRRQKSSPLLCYLPMKTEVEERICLFTVHVLKSRAEFLKTDVHTYAEYSRRHTVSCFFLSYSSNRTCCNIRTPRRFSRHVLEFNLTPNFPLVCCEPQPVTRRVESITGVCALKKHRYMKYKYF